MKVNSNLLLKNTGSPESVILENGKPRVVTDTNSRATYQLRSNPLEVEPGDRLSVRYRITVEEGGEMSLGWLNITGKGWCGPEKRISGGGTHEGAYESIVPQGGTKTCLVFRNYHLTEPNNTTFTIEGLEVAHNKPPTSYRLALSPFDLISTGHPQKIKSKGGFGKYGKITVTTENSDRALYQLKSDPTEVKEGEVLDISYKITVKPGGIMSLGWLNSAKLGWYPSQNKSEPPELILDNKTGTNLETFEGTYTRVVPFGESTATLIFRNYHLTRNGGPGQTTFSIEDLRLERS